MLWYVITACAALFKRLVNTRCSVCPSNRGRKWTRTRRRSPKVASVVIGLTLVGCTQTKAFYRAESTQRRTSEVGVLLMPPDVELYELTAGAMLEPKAQWTATARKHVTTALREELQAKKAKLFPYQPPTDMPSKDYAHSQLLKLHEAVGTAILSHKYIPRLELPNKKDKFDWSLGDGVNLLREGHETEYALFIYLRDSYASAGRVTFIVLAAVFSLGRYVPSAGTQAGFASLIDLRSGDILWFNRLISETGDLRTPGPARKAVKELLADLPL